MEKIKSIHGAFSMQPASESIKTEVEMKKDYLKEKCCKEIKEMGIYVGGELLTYYVGFSWEGKKMFQYLANTVNVYFDTE